ncbi:hypothetical protein [Aestuariivirga sp.]|uniref:hypothetical protein n=1 Tax=Aestuariivirga sp. TaxID=2650926 RepID=UPI0025BF3398|nr:hypothetical protein [Aestuariivirga sp.]
MRNVRAFVERSGNSSLRGYFGSDAVDFDPPSLSLRQNIRKDLAKRVYDLASGATGDDEEDEIRDLMAGAVNSYELIRMMQAIGGWPGLDDELPESHLDDIAQRLMRVLDQRDYAPHRLGRRHLTVLDYDAPPTLDQCFRHFLLAWPAPFRGDEIDLILADKQRLLKDVTRAALRERVVMAGAATIDPATVTQYAGAGLHRGGELVALMHETRYTLRICSALARLDYFPLYDVILDMARPLPVTTAQRIACRDTCVRLQPEFAAAARLVALAGSGEAKATVNRFTNALQAAIDNFPAAPNPGILNAVAAALNGVAGSIADLVTLVSNLPEALLGEISVASILGTDEDDKARLIASELHALSLLGQAPFRVKTAMINALLSGSTDDDDEIAIIRILEESRALCQAEVYQLSAAATWESLYSCVDGDEYDILESVLDEPA